MQYLIQRTIEQSIVGLRKAKKCTHLLWSFLAKQTPFDKGTSIKHVIGMFILRHQILLIRLSDARKKEWERYVYEQPQYKSDVRNNQHVNYLCPISSLYAWMLHFRIYDYNSEHWAWKGLTYNEGFLIGRGVSPRRCVNGCRMASLCFHCHTAHTNTASRVIRHCCGPTKVSL